MSATGVTLDGVFAVTGIPSGTSQYEIQIGNLPSRSTGSFKIRLKMNSIAAGTGYERGPEDDLDTMQINFITGSASATADWSNVSYTDGKLQGDITFGGVTGNITSVQADRDFEVLNDSDIVQSTGPNGWQFEALDSSTIAVNTAVTIAVTPPAGTNGDFKLKIKTTSVRSDGATVDNAPISSSNLTDTRISPSISVDNRVFTVATAEWSNENGGRTLTGRLTFRGGVTITNIASTDFAVVNACLLYTSPSPRD